MARRWNNRLSGRQYANDLETDGGFDFDEVDSGPSAAAFSRLQITDRSCPGSLRVTEHNLDSGVHSMSSILTNQTVEDDDVSVLRDHCIREEPEVLDVDEDVCDIKVSKGIVSQVPTNSEVHYGDVQVPTCSVVHYSDVQVPTNSEVRVPTCSEVHFSYVQLATFSEYDLQLQKLISKCSRTLRPNEGVDSLMTELYKRDIEQNTLLHWVVVLELVDVCLSLIKRTRPSQLLDLRNDLRQTALILAVLTKQSVVVHALVKAGANLTLVDRHGDSAYHIAARNGDLDSLIVLSPSMNQRLLAVINTHNNDGLCPVHLAAIAGHTHILSYLHKIGADMNKRDGTTGYTPLHHAIRKHRDMSEGLMKHLVENVNVDLSTEDYSERTPLMLAEGYRCFDTVAYLVNHGPGREWLYCPPMSSEDSAESDLDCDDDEEDMGFAEV